MRYVPPGPPDSIISVGPYKNFIDGKRLAPMRAKYRLDLAPVTAGPITKVADSTPEDIEIALDAAHAAKDAWGEALATPVGEFLIADIDVMLGEIDGCPFYIDKRLDRAWQQEQFLLDVAAGEPEDFSLPAGDNLHFVTRSPTRVSKNAPEENAPSSTAPESEWSTS
jgi:uncharacterized protein (DUF779 family)